MDLWSFCILNLHDEVILINLANMVQLALKNAEFTKTISSSGKRYSHLSTKQKGAQSDIFMSMEDNNWVKYCNLVNWHLDFNL